MSHGFFFRLAFPTVRLTQAMMCPRCSCDGVPKYGLRRGLKPSGIGFKELVAKYEIGWALNRERSLDGQLTWPSGAVQRNSYKKNPDRPCKCEQKDHVLEGTAPWRLGT